MPATDRSITTVEEFLALPENPTRRQEFLRGEYVVTPSPLMPHQAFIANLHIVLAQILAPSGAFRIFPNQGDLVLGENTIVQPDLFVIPRTPVSTPWRDVPKPVLVVEVLSPSTVARDRGVKREIYQTAGVAEYWIVDIDSKLIERWRPADTQPEILRTEIDVSVGSATGQITIPPLFE